jgi:predicted lipoprotein
MCLYNTAVAAVVAVAAVAAAVVAAAVVATVPRLLQLQEENKPFCKARSEQLLHQALHPFRTSVQPWRVIQHRQQFCISTVEIFNIATTEAVLPSIAL